MKNFKINQVTHLETEQLWSDETTRYWFEVSYTDEGEEKTETFALAESGPHHGVDGTLLDSEGHPADNTWYGPAIKEALASKIEKENI